MDYCCYINGMNMGALEMDGAAVARRRFARFRAPL